MNRFADQLSSFHEQEPFADDARRNWSRIADFIASNEDIIGWTRRVGAVETQSLSMSHQWVEVTDRSEQIRIIDVTFPIFLPEFVAIARQHVGSEVVSRLELSEVIVKHQLDPGLFVLGETHEETRANGVAYRGEQHRTDSLRSSSWILS